MSLSSGFDMPKSIFGRTVSFDFAAAAETGADDAVVSWLTT